MAQVTKAPTIKWRVLEKIPGQLKVSFLIFLTLGLIKQNNTQCLKDQSAILLLQLYSRSHWGWYFRMLFQSSKFKARTSLLSRFSEKRRSSFELWAFERAFEISPHEGLAVHKNIYSSWSSLRTRVVVVALAAVDVCVCACVCERERERENEHDVVKFQAQVSGNAAN